MEGGEAKKPFRAITQGAGLSMISEPSQLIGDRSKRTPQLARLALIAIALITSGILFELLLNQFVFKGFPQSRKDGLMNGRGTLFQPLNQPIDCQSGFWYLKDQAKVHRDLAQRIPPFFGFSGPSIKKESVLFYKGKLICRKVRHLRENESYLQSATRASEIFPFGPPRPT